MATGRQKEFKALSREMRRMGDKYLQEQGLGDHDALLAHHEKHRMAIEEGKKDKIILTPAQEQRLREVFEFPPPHRLWPDIQQYDGKGRNPTFRALSRLGLVEYTHAFGNSFHATLTMKGILYLHGEEI